MNAEQESIRKIAGTSPWILVGLWALGFAVLPAIIDFPRMSGGVIAVLIPFCVFTVGTIQSLCREVERLREKLVERQPPEHAQH